MVMLDPPPLASVHAEEPFAGYKNLRIERLGHVTLVVGPAGSGKSQMLQALGATYGWHRPRQAFLRPISHDLAAFPPDYFLEMRDALRWSGRHPAHRWMAVGEFAEQMQIPDPLWEGDLGHLAPHERATLAMAMCVTMTVPRTVSLLDNLDCLEGGERWPLIWRFVLDRLAVGSEVQVVAAARDYDIAGALALARDSVPQSSATLVGLGAHRHLADHVIVGEYHDWDAQTVRQLAASAHS